MLETFSENFPGIIVSNIVEYSALFSYRICKKVSEDVPNDWSHYSFIYFKRVPDEFLADRYRDIDVYNFLEEFWWRS